MNRDIVLIEWADSKGVTNWEDVDEIKPMPPVECLSVGFLLEDKKDYKTIAIGLGGKQVLGRLTIPSGCIKKVTRLTM